MANVERAAAIERPPRPEVALRRPRRGAGRRLFSWDRPWPWLLPVVLLLLGLGIYPLLYNLYNSFREFDAVAGGWESVGFANWTQMATDDRVHGALWTTFRYVAIALVVEFVLGLGIALLFNSGPWASGLWQSLLILPMVIPPTVAGLMFSLLQNSEFGVISWLLYETGLLDKTEPLVGGTGRWALPAVLLPDIWQWTPFFVLILLAGLKALPTEPLEASQVDGATAWQTFRHVTLPMLRPMIAIAVLFRLVDLLKVFDYIRVMTNGGPGRATEVVSLYAYLQSFEFIKWGYGSALGLGIMLLAIVVANLYVRIFKVEW
jgi:multiple sugar transport system permease protein